MNTCRWGSSHWSPGSTKSLASIRRQTCTGRLAEHALCVGGAHLIPQRSTLGSFGSIWEPDKSQTHPGHILDTPCLPQLETTKDYANLLPHPKQVLELLMSISRRRQIQDKSQTKSKHFWCQDATTGCMSYPHLIPQRDSSGGLVFSNRGRDKSPTNARHILDTSWSTQLSPSETLWEALVFRSGTETNPRQIPDTS